MPMLRCAFWLTIVYASILLHPRATPGGAADAGDARAIDARMTGAETSGAGLAGVDAAGLVASCARRAGACGEAALAAARGDAGRLAALVAASVGGPDATNPPAGHGADVPSPVPGPRRHARARLLTGAP